jgi:hypothetical protein
MWIYKREKFVESTWKNLNFIYNSGKVYFMDNHLAAAWCWMQKVRTDSICNFFHIDRHYDMVGMTQSVNAHIVEKQISISDLSIEGYLGLRQITTGDQIVPLFRYDTYLMNLVYAYPQIFELSYFATHQDGTKNDDLDITEVEVVSLERNIEYWIRENTTRRWIVNIDLDYFFKEPKGGV